MKYVFHDEERTSGNTHVMAGAFFCYENLQSLHLTYLFSPDGVSTGQTGHFSLKPSYSASLRNDDASFPLEPYKTSPVQLDNERMLIKPYIKKKEKIKIKECNKSCGL
jgi:hypothetical protein